MSGKYTPETLLPALRLFIEARNKANAAGFPDNGGAIHSVERIIDVLCIRVKYGLTHVNNLKKCRPQNAVSEHTKPANVAMHIYYALNTSCRNARLQKDN